MNISRVLDDIESACVLLTNNGNRIAVFETISRKIRIHRVYNVEYGSPPSTYREIYGKDGTQTPLCPRTVCAERVRFFETFFYRRYKIRRLRIMRHSKTTMKSTRRSRWSTVQGRVRVSSVGYDNRRQ